MSWVKIGRHQRDTRSSSVDRDPSQRHLAGAAHTLNRWSAVLSQVRDAL